MAALADQAKPGPWGPATHRYGPFFGIREEGRLLAMAGQRILVPGMAEVSGVATWSDCRGRGLSRALIGHVMREMVARGETPFLHSYADNAGRSEEHTSEPQSLLRTSYADFCLHKKTPYITDHNTTF